MELSLNIRGRPGLSRQVYRELRRAIFDGRLRLGEKLPSTRELAVRLGVSRNTVSEAYERLTSEGYLVARTGSGTFVTQNLFVHAGSGQDHEASGELQLTPWATRLKGIREIEPRNELPYDFRPGVPDIAHFPIDTWRRIAARNLRIHSPSVADYGEAGGTYELRCAIARYLAHARAVHCEGEDVVVVNGSQQALDLLGRIFINRGDVVAIEDPGYPPARLTFSALGAHIVPVPVDEEGIQVDLLPETARLLYVTPSHQFPLGVTLSLSRRSALLAWAVRCGAVIIEDDYDSEFRFGGRPLESLQGTDPAGVVVYLGTFSKALFPSLRLGYIVAPHSLQSAILNAKWSMDRHCPTLEQQMVASFIAEGHFGKHLRRMQKIYADRFGTLMNALSRWVPELSVFPCQTGLHLTGMVTEDISVEKLTALAATYGVGLYSLSSLSFYLNEGHPGLIFGYGNCDTMVIEEGVHRLSKAFKQLRQSAS